MKKILVLFYLTLLVSATGFSQRINNFTSIPYSKTLWSGGSNYSFPLQPAKASDFDTSDGEIESTQGTNSEIERYTYTLGQFNGNSTSVGSAAGYNYSYSNSTQPSTYRRLTIDVSAASSRTVNLYRCEQYYYEDQGGNKYNYTAEVYNTFFEDRTYITITNGITASNTDVCLGSSLNLDNHVNNGNGDSYSGPGVSGSTFSASSAGVGTHTITASKSYENGTKTISFQIQVLSESFTVSSTPTICVNESLNLQSYTSKTTTFSGSGVNGSVITGTSSGSKSVTATYTNGNGCTSSKTFSVSVVSPPNANAGSDRTICSDVSDFSINGGRSGTWSGTGISSSGVVDVSALSTGNNTFTYTLSNGACSDSDNVIIHVDPVPSFTFSSLPTVCYNSNSINLQSYTSETTSFSGSGVSGSRLYPSSAGTGTHTITAERTVNGCTTTKTRNITINNTEGVNAGGNISACFDGNRIELPAASDEEWSGDGVSKVSGVYYWYPSNASTGSSTLTKYVNKGEICENSDTKIATKYAAPTVNLSSSDLTHYNYKPDGSKATSLDLTQLGLTPSGGGTFTATGSSFNDGINNSTYMVDVSGQTAHYDLTVTYTYTDGNGCTSSDNAVIKMRGLNSSQFEVDDVERCGSGSVTFSGSWKSSNSWWEAQHQYYEVVWLNAADQVLNTGSTYTTPTLNADKTYYYALREKSSGRISNRIEVLADIIPLPSPAIGGDVVVCNDVSGSYDLKNDEPSGQANGVWSSSDISISDGVISATDLGGTNPVTVRYTYENASGCSGYNEKEVYFGSPLEVVASDHSPLVKGIVDGELLSTYDLSNLNFSPGGGTFTSNDAEVQAAINNSNYTLDLTQIGGTGLSRTADITYSVVDQNGCTVSDEATLTITKDLNNGISTIESGVCESGSVELEASSNQVGADIAWFNAETGADSPIHVGERYTTTSLTQTRTYYVSEYNSDLDTYGERKAVTAFVYPRPTLEIGSDVYICDAVAGSYDLKNDEPTGKTDGVWSSRYVYF